jgi:hypothetical protein
MFWRRSKYIIRKPLFVQHDVSQPGSLLFQKSMKSMTSLFETTISKIQWPSERTGRTKFFY